MAEQMALLKIAVERDIDGLEMGVLEDGTPYLSARSLAKLTGAAISTILNQGERWKEGRRDNKLAQMLVERGITRGSLYVEIATPSGTKHAYTDDVCMTFLEYYAFESPNPNEVAKQNFRRLAHASLRLFIYSALGWSPQYAVPPAWRSFHDRLSINTNPRGHFSVFMELSQFVLHLIQNGLQVDTHTVPDISVGRTWSDHWEENGLALTYGERRKYQHRYPDNYNQLSVVESWVYPLAALPAFREWLHDVYVPEKFPNYIKGKVKRQALPPSVAELLLAAFEDDAPPQLPPAT